MPVEFHHQRTGLQLQDQQRHRRWIESLFSSGSHKHPTIRFVFCSDDFLVRINRDFLQHDTLTDVVTFVLDEDETSLESEIYISTERVEDNAGIYAVATDVELRRVMAHGVLHLIGFNDKDEFAQRAMRTEEDRWLRRYNQLK